MFVDGGLETHILFHTPLSDPRLSIQSPAFRPIPTQEAVHVKKCRPDRPAVTRPVLPSGGPMTFPSHLRCTNVQLGSPSSSSQQKLQQAGSCFEASTEVEAAPGGVDNGGSETGGLQIPEMKSTLAPTATSNAKRRLATATLATVVDSVVTSSPEVSRDVRGEGPASTAQDALEEAPPDEGVGTGRVGVVGKEGDEEPRRSN